MPPKIHQSVFTHDKPGWTVYLIELRTLFNDLGAPGKSLHLAIEVCGLYPKRFKLTS